MKGNCIMSFVVILNALLVRVFYGFLLMWAAHVPSFWWEHSRFLPTIRGWFPLELECEEDHGFADLLCCSPEHQQNRRTAQSSANGHAELVNPESKMM